MGKVKTARGAAARGSASTEIASHEALFILRSLSSLQAVERVKAAIALAAIVDPDAVKHSATRVQSAEQVDRLAAADLPKKLCERLVDPEFVVRLHALGALRNFVLVGLPSSLASIAASNCVPTVLRCIADSMALVLSQADGRRPKVHSHIVSEGLLLLQQLVESIPALAHAVVSLGAPGLFGLLKQVSVVPGAAAPLSTTEPAGSGLCAAALRLLRGLTEVDSALCFAIRGSPEQRSLVGRLATGELAPLGGGRVEATSARTHAAGIIANCFLRPGGDYEPGSKVVPAAASLLTAAAVKEAIGVISGLAQATLVAWEPLQGAVALASAMENARLASFAADQAANDARLAISAHLAAVKHRGVADSATKAAPPETPPRSAADTDDASDGDGGGDEAELTFEAPGAAELPAVVHRRQATAASAAARVAYRRARAAWFAEARAAVQTLELLTDIVAAPDSEFEEGDDADMGDLAAPAVLPVDPLAPLSIAQHAAVCVSALVSTGLPQLLLSVLDRSLRSLPLQATASVELQALSSLPRRFRSSAGLALSAATERCAAVLSNLASSYASSSAARPSDAAPLWTALAAASHAVAHLDSRDAASCTLVWLAPSARSPQALAAAASAVHSSAGEGITADAVCAETDASIDDDADDTRPVAIATDSSGDTEAVLSAITAEAEAARSVGAEEAYGDAWVADAATAALVAAEPENSDALPHAEVIASALCSSDDVFLAHARLVILPQLMLALRGAVDLAHTGSGVGALPLQPVDLDLARRVASRSATPADSSAQSPHLVALRKLEGVIALEVEARMHAVGLLGALASASGGSFVIDGAAHASVGVVLAALLNEEGSRPSASDFMLRIAAADAIMDAYAEDDSQHDAAFAAGRVLPACDMALVTLEAGLKLATARQGGAPSQAEQLDREAARHARDVLSNLRRFVEYKRGRA